MDDNQIEKNISTNEMTAGEMLRVARTTGRRKREISTIAQSLCIREEFLSALEEGNYRLIPEDVYILGFARSYAVELGLDPEEVITKIKHELGLVQEEAEEKQDKPVKSMKEILSKDNVKRMANEMWNFVKSHWLLCVGIFVGLITIITLLIVFSNKNHANDVSDLDINAEIIGNKVAEPDFRYPVRDKFELKNSKTARVVLQAEKESWVKIEDARGSTVFSRVLIPGDVYYMPNINNYKGTFGNVGGIDVWVDGQLVNKLGPANTRKSGISMSPDALKTAGVAE